MIQFVPDIYIICTCHIIKVSSYLIISLNFAAMTSTLNCYLPLHSKSKKSLNFKPHTKKCVYYLLYYFVCKCDMYKLLLGKEYHLILSLLFQDFCSSKDPFVAHNPWEAMKLHLHLVPPFLVSYLSVKRGLTL